MELDRHLDQLLEKVEGALLALLLILQPDGNIGRGIFEAKKAAFFLEKEL